MLLLLYTGVAHFYPITFCQVIQCKEYSKRCDLFSYGTVLWELVTHEVPFEGKTPLDILNAIVEGKVILFFP